MKLWTWITNLFKKKQPIKKSNVGLMGLGGKYIRFKKNDGLYQFTGKKLPDLLKSHPGSFARKKWKTCDDRKNWRFDSEVDGFCNLVTDNGVIASQSLQSLIESNYSDWEPYFSDDIMKKTSKFIKNGATCHATTIGECTMDLDSFFSMLAMNIDKIGNKESQIDIKKLFAGYPRKDLPANLKSEEE